MSDRHESSAGGGTGLVEDWHEDPWDAAPDASEVELVRQSNGVGRALMYFVLIAALIAVLVAGVYGWRYVEKANPSGEPGAPVQFLVEEGDTLQTISVRLEQEGLIDDAGFFRSYVNGKGGIEVMPGRYVIRPGDHVGNVMARLSRAPGETIVRVTFPEGFTISQMAARLADNENLPQFTAEDFIAAATSPEIHSRLRPAGIDSLEGLLFPATYEVSNADDATAVVNRMVANLEDRVAAQVDLDNRAAALGRSSYDIMIIASMIEREARTAADRPQIARVIYNRLEIGMPLQIDATALYRVDGSLRATQPGDVDAAIAIPSEWNTFTVPALPLTPISNPGRASIEAALNPAPALSPGDARCQGELPYGCRLIFYVLADSQGNHSFSVTPEQFEADRQRAFELGLLGVGNQPTDAEDEAAATTAAPG